MLREICQSRINAGELVFFLCGKWVGFWAGDSGNPGSKWGEIGDFGQNLVMFL